MTYADKLKNPKWFEFREDFFQWFRQVKKRHTAFCEACGDDVDRWHLHHKRYEDGKEPWEYEFEDMKMLCAGCHKEIHAVERMVRAWVISLKSNHLMEFENLIKVLMEFGHDQGTACHIARHELYEYRDRLDSQERRKAGKTIGL